jgi:cobalamin biosynthesis protein CobT
VLADDTEAWESPPQVRSDQANIESQAIGEMRRMELLLVKEMEIWEEHLWDQANKFIGRDDVLEKAQLSKEWKRAFRMRVDSKIHAMVARLDAAELEVKASRNDSNKLMGKW